MPFILLLFVATAAIAGSAAYFSVYGLAHTFSGVFWSMVVMGTSLEAGKLMGASYLYRYWTKTNLALKCYMLAGIAALMLLTSVGIFGYLSSGYQQDVLPLKQKQEQVRILDEEKARLTTRKAQIDQQLTSGPTITSVQRGSGLDPNAARVLRESTRAREALVRQYKEEQQQVNSRINELDKQLLTLKQDLISAESHVGPILYIATAFGAQPDDATKYLIFIIIFAFDPMALALTLALNTALRLRKEEQEEAQKQPVVEPQPDPIPESLPEVPRKLDPALATTPVNNLEELQANAQLPFLETPTKNPLEPTPLEPAPIEEPVVEALPPEEPSTPDEPREESPPPAQEYTGGWKLNHRADQITELFNHYRSLVQKRDAGLSLSPQEQWELGKIKTILEQSNLSRYV